ncbi:hypothetical protein like AT3G60580 [Hibiscus trionum]|uniref:C2H2-type domain-containing protein n=1 Tax=Hibiscus trionum TaxID=183268 RepID=A0A9W7H235_HIBTR|nr:hypothetical protein like AT3G60580 [Hibiscus trionum]
MEKHRCKLCLKSFVNGRALGGHMRSHMLNLPVPTNQLSQESEAASASYSSDEKGEEKKGQIYRLRDNPKRSVRMVDPQFVDAASVVLQDRESETESSKNPNRRRSKRPRKILDREEEDDDDDDEEEEEKKKLKVNINQLSKTESWAEPEPEPVSSISDTTTEEDVAFCLMMLSRDQWKRKIHQDEEDEEEEEETDESEGYFKLSKVNNNNNNRTARAKYRCETCNKVFKSYQALGGHRASHKKIKAYTPVSTHETGNVGACSMPEKKLHECPVCFRVFSSGQALGGHKRSHVTAQVAATTTKTAVKSSKKLGDSLIDLNLPAPIDDDDASQIELSAVSDAEFVK